MMASMEEAIVLCLNATDSARAIALVQSLESIGLMTTVIELAPFFRDVGAETKLHLAAAGARYVALGLSAEWFAGSESAVGRCLQVLGEAAMLKTPERPFLVPVRLEPCEVPAALAHLQHIDLFESSSADRLAKYLESDLLLFTDSRDGQIYPTVKIGTRIWLARNLDYDLSPPGGSWPVLAGSAVPWGCLYTWESARAACPVGWHLPSDQEWRELALGCGGYRDMDEGYPGTGVSRGHPEKAFDVLMRGGSSGFDAQLSGVRTIEGAFEERGRTGAYWTSTGYEYTTQLNYSSALVQTAWVYVFYTLSGQVQVRRDYELPIFRSALPLNKRWALSVRCVRDERREPQ
jgi:uncharacterized protein (TIGR02145 family)